MLNAYAIVLWKAGAIEKAHELFNDLIQEASHGDPFSNMATLLMSSGQADEALYIVKQWFLRRPQDKNAYEAYYQALENRRNQGRPKILYYWSPVDTFDEQLAKIRYFKQSGTGINLHILTKGLRINGLPNDLVDSTLTMYRTYIRYVPAKTI